MKKKVLVYSDNYWSLGRVNKDIEKYINKDYVFTFCDWAKYKNILNIIDDFDIILTNLCNLHIFQNFNICLKKFIFVCHGYPEFNKLDNCNFTFPENTIYTITSESIKELFPENIKNKLILTSTGVDKDNFNFTQKNGQIKKIGWCGATHVLSKRSDWTKEIAKRTNLDYEIQSNLSFNQIVKWYNTIDVLIVNAGPEQWAETGPLPPFEAVLSGVLVIGTNVGNFQKIPGPKYNNIDEAVLILNDLKNNPEKVIEIMKTQYDFVINNFTIDKIIDNWNKVFDMSLKLSLSSDNNLYNNFLDFIEIGTSDFDTEIQKATNETKGISIEPIKYYLDKLPEKLQVSKLNFAISDSKGISKIYYVPEEKIIKYNLPSWVKGCNSINDYHKTIINLINNKNLNKDEVFSINEISKTTLFEIYNLYNVQGLFFLKIDTEGHDCVIINKFFNDLENNYELYPHTILFEANILTNISEVNKTLSLLSSKGYDLISQDDNVFLRLNLNKIMNKSKFTKGIKKYYIQDYPVNYNPVNPPHENTFESAKKYCIENCYSGVTFQYGRYEVRSGKYLNYYNDKNLISWLFL